MKELLNLLTIVLVIGGILAACVGLLWYKGGSLLEFFGWEVRAEWGLKLAVAGLACIAAGFGLVYLTR